MSKVDRADEHLNTLEQAFAQFAPGFGYTFEIQPYDEQPNGIADARIVLRVHASQPWLRWAAIIGDVVHNLRSALDHLVYHLSFNYQVGIGKLPPSEFDTRPETDRLRKLWTQVAFPIGRRVSSSPDGWESGHTAYLRYLDPALVARFRQLQPFSSGVPYATHWLGMLNELWNRDKHRVVTFSAAKAQITEITTAGPSVGNYAVQVLEIKPLWQVADGIEVGRLRVTPIGKTPPPVVGLDLAVAFAIAFGFGEPGYDLPVAHTLREIRERVVQTLEEFRADL